MISAHQGPLRYRVLWLGKMARIKNKMEKTMRRFVIGDIHGNHRVLIQVLKKAKFDYDKDFLIIIGDVVDGYNSSFQVVEELIKVKNKVFIIGNHDIWWMNHIKNGWAEDIWLSQGGQKTINSYTNAGYDYKKLPESHKEFFNSGVYYYEVDYMMFVHGGFRYPTHPKNETPETLTWDRTLIERCKNGLVIKRWDKIFIGHTTTEHDGAEPIIYQEEEKGGGQLIMVDCGAGWKGRLCIYDIDTDEYFLSDYAHELNPKGRT